MFDNFFRFVRILLEASVITVEATLAGAAIAVFLAFLAGLTQLSRSRVLRGVARTYVELFRGSSEVVQLFWFYAALPILVGYTLVPLFAGILVLGLNLGAYGAEVVRGAILSVPREQYEGATALNMSPGQRMFRVILPQAVVGMLPPFNNLFIQLLKATSLLYLITVDEITSVGTRLANNSGQALLVFALILVFYFILSYIITLFMRLLERRANAMIGKAPRGSGLMSRIKPGEAA